jgi:hypothetical protein
MLSRLSSSCVVDKASVLLGKVARSKTANLKKAATCMYTGQTTVSSTRCLGSRQHGDDESGADDQTGVGTMQQSTKSIYTCPSRTY